MPSIQSSQPEQITSERWIDRGFVVYSFEYGYAYAGHLRGNPLTMTAFASAKIVEFL